MKKLAQIIIKSLGCAAFFLVVLTAPCGAQVVARSGARVEVRYEAQDKGKGVFAMKVCNSKMTFLMHF
jgi:multisubunit Na+/H+ antiporter MnhG subunit